MAWGKRKATVTHHHTGNVMVARARSQRVPVDLSIHVGMPIDKAWGNHMALGVENFFGAGADLANLPVDNTDIRAVAR